MHIFRNYDFLAINMKEKLQEIAFVGGYLPGST